MRHSHVFNVCAIFLKLLRYVLQLDVLYGIANQHFGSYLYPKWPPKIMENQLVKRKCVTVEKLNLVYVDLKPLMTNMAIFWSFITYITVKITEQTDIVDIWCRL